MAKKHKQKKRISCLGVLLIFCMLIIAAATLGVNLAFRGGKTLELMGKRYCHYSYDDMGDRIPAGSLVIVEDPALIHIQDIVLYNADDGSSRIAVASLIVDTSASTPELTEKTYYLTTATDLTAVPVSEKNIVGVCTRRSTELGKLVGFLTGTPGIAAGLIAPCVILLLYLIVVLVSGKDSDDYTVEENSDVEFVKSIHEKQRKIAARDAARREQRRRETQTFDRDFYEDEKSEPAGRTRAPRLSDEEMARLEEEEAARRAERIAAVRSHMEQRRQTETPDGVPLYTTEVITKTHTLSIPRQGSKPKKPARPAPRPEETENAPRLTATGRFRIPTEEEIAAEKREHEERLARKSARRPSHIPNMLESEPEVIPEEAPAVKEVIEEPEAKPARPARDRRSIDELLAEPVRKPRAAEPVEEKPEEPVVEPVVEPVAEPVVEAVAEPVVEAVAEPAAEPEAKAVEAAPAPVAEKPKKKKKKERIASASFDDLMSFLNDEQKKL